MIRVTENLKQVRDLLARTAVEAGRDPASVRLLAVSKKQPLDKILEAAAAGQQDFGENQVQEALTKIEQTQAQNLTWHFIGHLQTNKARHIPGNFAWLHTLDSLKLARKLSRHAEASGLVVKILLQINIAGDPDKFGMPPASVFPFVDELLQAGLKGIVLHGLMTIGRRDTSVSESHRTFSRLRELRDACAMRFGADMFRELSMGMSGDYEIAVAEGSTMVRIGSAIFGSRPERSD